MRLHRRPTRWLSGWMVVLLLFMQMVTAAYACPSVARSGSAAAEAGPSSAANTAPATMPGMPGCEGSMAGTLDPDQPQLCQAHCQQGSQTVHPTPTLDAPTTPLLLAVLDWARALPLPAHASGRGPALSSGAAPPGAPPLYIALLVLRN